MTTHEVVKNSLEKDIREKAVKYGTTNIQQLDKIVKSEKELSVSLLLSVKEVVDKIKIIEDYNGDNEQGEQMFKEKVKSLLDSEIEKIKNMSIHEVK